MPYRDPTPARLTAYVGVAILALVLFAGAVIGLIGGAKAFQRGQDMADAKNQASIARIHADNQVRVTAIQIRNQEQRVQVARQQAQIRLENARGVREAQDVIAKTLTPLYVQHEMTETLQEIARSGKNSSVIYIPSGAGGVPLISGVGNAPSVTTPSR
ncbi:hypothetical protein ABZ883_04565 [Streptomyces sp. NPDC046977]|uniref:hypothetical protein n=1 Tax=Streptomyces sp. NPDC046977 TaxID=3154703 RepID=UPI0033FD1CA5